MRDIDFFAISLDGYTDDSKDDADPDDAHDTEATGDACPSFPKLA